MVKQIFQIIENLQRISNLEEKIEINYQKNKARISLLALDSTKIINLLKREESVLNELKEELSYLRHVNVEKVKEQAVKGFSQKTLKSIAGGN